MIEQKVDFNDNVRTIQYRDTAKTNLEIEAEESIAYYYKDKNEKEQSEITIIYPSDIDVRIDNIKEDKEDKDKITKRVIYIKHK